MNKFSGMLLASDYDGTFVNDNGEIPSNNLDAIRYFISQGGRFTINTGRSKQGFYAYNKDLMNAPILLANGGMAYDYGAEKIVFTEGMDGDNIINFLYRTARIYPTVSIEIYSDKFNSFVVHPNELTTLHFDWLKLDYISTDSISEAEFPAVKIMIGAGKELSAPFQKYLSENLPEGIRHIKTEGEYIELLSTKAGKGNGNLHLADSLGISRARVFAVGDGSNDVDMLKSAAWSFVPKNGERLAKNAAKTVVCSNNDGAIANVIEEIERLYC